MTESWINTHGFSSVQEDTRTLSLNVLASAGLRNSHDFQSSNTAVIDGSKNYRDALQIVLDNATTLMHFPSWLLKAPFVPKSWVRVGKAASYFRSHIIKMLDDEMEAFKDGRPESGSLMTSFAHAVDLHDREVIGPGNPQKGLSVDEVLGNLFVLNFRQYIVFHDDAASWQP
ncbi:hypothetical protein Hte_010317 [Hypoxylon texense]